MMNDGKSGLKSRFRSRDYNNVRSVFDGRENINIAKRYIGFKATTATGEGFGRRKSSGFGGSNFGFTDRYQE